ncbi:hypothetical protein E2I00_006838, partial [Balaenoptera physalus]
RPTSLPFGKRVVRVGTSSGPGEARLLGPISDHPPTPARPKHSSSRCCELSGWAMCNCAGTLATLPALRKALGQAGQGAVQSKEHLYPASSVRGTSLCRSSIMQPPPQAVPSGVVRPPPSGSPQSTFWSNSPYRRQANSNAPVAPIACPLQPRAGLPGPHTNAGDSSQGPCEPLPGPPLQPRSDASPFPGVLSPSAPPGPEVNKRVEVAPGPEPEVQTPPYPPQYIPGVGPDSCRHYRPCPEGPVQNTVCHASNAAHFPAPSNPPNGFDPENAFRQNSGVGNARAGQEFRLSPGVNREQLSDPALINPFAQGNSPESHSHNSLGAGSSWTLPEVGSGALSMFFKGGETENEENLTSEKAVSAGQSDFDGFSPSPGLGQPPAHMGAGGVYQAFLKGSSSEPTQQGGDPQPYFSQSAGIRHDKATTNAAAVDMWGDTARAGTHGAGGPQYENVENLEFIQNQEVLPTRPHDSGGTFIQQEVGKPEDEAPGRFFKQVDSSPVGGETDESTVSQNYRGSLPQPLAPSPPKPTGIFQTSANSSFEPVKSHFTGVKPVEADRANVVGEVRGPSAHQKQRRAAAAAPDASPGNLEQPPDNMETLFLPRVCVPPLTTPTEASSGLLHATGPPLEAVLPAPEKRPLTRAQGAVKCESPATTLWAQNELPDFGGNVLLAPAAPALHVPAKPQPSEVIQPPDEGVCGQQSRQLGPGPAVQSGDGIGASENLENPPQMGEEEALPSQAGPGYATLLSSPPTESLQNQPVLVAQPDQSYNLVQPVNFSVSSLNPKEKNQSWRDSLVGDKPTVSSQAAGGDSGEDAPLPGTPAGALICSPLPNRLAQSNFPQVCGASEMVSSQPANLLVQPPSHPVPKNLLPESQKIHNAESILPELVTGPGGSTGVMLVPPVNSTSVPDSNTANHSSSRGEASGALDFTFSRSLENPVGMYSPAQAESLASCQQTVSGHRPRGPGAHSPDRFYQQVTTDAQDQHGPERAQQEPAPPPPPPQGPRAALPEPSNPAGPPAQGQPPNPTHPSASPAPADMGQQLPPRPPRSSSVSVASTSSSQAAARSDQQWLQQPPPPDLASYYYYRSLYDGYQPPYPSPYPLDPGTAPHYYQDVYGLYEPRYRPYDGAAAASAESYRYPELERPSSRASHCSDRPAARQGYPEGYYNSKSGWSSQSDYYANYYSSQYDYGGPGHWDRYQYGSQSRDPRTYDRRCWYDAECDPYRKESYAYGDRSVEEVLMRRAGPPSRPTSPEKFSVPHICARFGPGGQLIKVIPNLPSEGQPALVEIHSMETLLQHTPEQEEMRAFPGPLGKDDTHKVDVINFAQSKATNCLQDENLIDKESASLLWSFIVLLCRQNGTVVGTDIAELLLRDHRTVWLPGKSPSEANLIDFTHEPAAQVEEESGEAQLSFLTDSQAATTLEKDTERFRELLLYGRKKVREPLDALQDALESAMKNGLWGHALLLASKMDSRTHARCCGDEKWGDWRPHLAMVLSNLNNNVDVEARTMATMGDTLASRGLLDAAHFCYLVAQVGFGVYTKKTTKLVLLGSNHRKEKPLPWLTQTGAWSAGASVTRSKVTAAHVLHSLPFLKFATNEAIQRTEAYEYAQSLGAQTCSLPSFQVFKFIYCCRLAEMGLATQAFHYCEVIARSVLAQPHRHSPVLLSQLLQRWEVPGAAAWGRSRLRPRGPRFSLRKTETRHRRRALSSRGLAVDPQGLHLAFKSPLGLILWLRTQGLACRLAHHLSKRLNICSRRPGARTQRLLATPTPSAVALVMPGSRELSFPLTGMMSQEAPGRNALSELGEEDFGGRFANVGSWGGAPGEPAPCYLGTGLLKDVTGLRVISGLGERWLRGPAAASASASDARARHSEKRIVWDEKKNRWVDTNEPEEERKPGPVHSGHQEDGGVTLLPVPVAARARARYVDVLNPGGPQRSEPTLAPADFFAPLAPLPIPTHLFGPNPDAEEAPPAEGAGTEGQAPTGGPAKPEPTSEPKVLSSAASLPGPERPPSGADGSQGGEVNGAR